MVRTPSRAHAQRGVTLIELMITVVVASILLAVALPAFFDQIRKSRRSDAVQSLTAIQQAQERRRANAAAYTTALTASAPTGLGLSSSSGSGYYTLAIDAADATSYQVTATAVTGKSQANDGNCVRLRIRMAGGNLFYGSATASGGFDESAGNRCWARQ